MTRKSEPGYFEHTSMKYEKRIISKEMYNMKFEKRSFIFFGANMTYEAWISNFKKP